jgi:hypothetical protein
MTSRATPRQYEFVPRIINPVRIGRAVFFTGEAELRESKRVLEDLMPWLRTEILADPLSAAGAVSEEPVVYLCDDAGLAILDVERIRRQNPNAVLALLSYQTFIQRSPPQAARGRYPYTAKADLVFAVNRSDFPPPRIIPSVVRAAEDLLNILKNPPVRRYIFHIVDDEPRWFSQFLPVLYEIIGQRAAIRITRTYEETLQFLFGVEEESEIPAHAYQSRGKGDDVVCLIADIFFPRGDDLQRSAGRDLIRLMSKFYPRIPVIIASKAPEARELKELGFVLPKGDPDSLERLRDHILNQTGLGDFLISDGAGRELFRARNIRGICQILLEAENDSSRGRELREILERYGEEDRFSTWLYMHSYRELGDRLRPRRSRGRQLVTLLKRNLQSEIARLARTPLLLEDRKIFSLEDLRAAIRSLDPGTIQPYSDNDMISSWLDRQGYTELAEELRPIHGSGAGLSRTLARTIEKWIGLYKEKDRRP